MESSVKRLVLILFIFSTSWASVFAQKDIEARKLQLALYAISNLYVDSTSQTKLVEDAITGMLENLDPHSTYTNPEETKEMTEPLAGNFDGIGIQFNMLTDTVYVIQVVSGGPSEKVGLMAGDRIVEVNDTVIAGVKMSTPEVMKRLRGPKGSEVHVKVKRGEEPQLLDFTITRGKVPVYSIDAVYMADKETGYIKLNRFAASSTKEFKEALSSLSKKGMTQLILDLQGNVLVVSAYKKLSAGRIEGIESLVADARAVGLTPIVLVPSNDILAAALVSSDAVDGNVSAGDLSVSDAALPEWLDGIVHYSDYKTLATLNRSNGGATWISDGQIVRKWSYTLRPSREKLSTALAEDPAALALETGSRGSLALQGFLLYVFAVLLLL